MESIVQPGEEDGASVALIDDDAGAVWHRALEDLRSRLPEGNYSAWFGRTEPLSFADDVFVLGVPNQFAKDWIESRYMAPLQEALSRSARRPLTVTLQTSARPEVPPEEVLEPERAAEVAPPPQALPPAGEPLPLHPRYNFDSFVIGSSNRFAHAAALAVAEAPAQAYNPLFIYGGAGLGKTHLLHAIGHYVASCHPHLKVRYVSTEQFMNQFIQAVQRRAFDEFHRRYRAVDLLLVDDVQFLEGKERTQEEFFHTFNSLHPRSQIVLTSDRPPKKISPLEERLRTRFEWGLITDIQPPDLETRMAILQKKSEAENLPVPAEVLSYIASRIQTNIRELEGALIRVVAYASLMRSTITVDHAQNVLQSLLPDAHEARVTADLVISVTAEYFDVTPDEIRSASRSNPLVTARHTAMYLCRELTDLSLPKIGERFGGKDHSTVVHATTKIRHQMQQSESCYEQIKELTTRIRQQASRG